MILTFAFMSMLVFTTAKLTYIKAGEGQELPSKNVLRRLTQKMMGDCTLKQFTYSTARCKQEFFLTFFPKR